MKPSTVEQIERAYDAKLQFDKTRDRAFLQKRHAILFEKKEGLWHLCGKTDSPAGWLARRNVEVKENF